MTGDLERYKAKLSTAELKIQILEGMIENYTREMYLQNLELEQKNKQLEQFTYISSHDLQEPLRSVATLASMLNDKYAHGLDDMAKKGFGFIIQATERMSQLIKGLLDYSRLGQHPAAVPTDTGQLVQHVQDDLVVAIQTAQATFEIGELPTIRAYEMELRLLFQNLVNNAVKFARPGVAPHIRISAQREATHWKFAVADNGIGIEPQYADKIFIIFQRLHGRQEYEGIGIGLAHCKRIAELHHGHIWFESTPGRGTTFFFTIKADL